MSHRPTGHAPSRLVAVLGPTNTGKTHLAVERMLGHASGMIGLPLRLLAREVYDRIVKARGARAVALITGEEKIIPPRAHYFVCTVEAMPLSRRVEFLAVDEIQLAADPERGHVFTDRMLDARGDFETMLLGSGTMAPLIRRLLPGAELTQRERFSSLTSDGARKLTRLPRRSAVVAFSSEQVYAIAELIRRQRGGAAVVMGSLSPRTRNAQVALYQSGEVDFLVATDAIGMGLNMDVDHVAFAGLAKFDGRRHRPLHAHEVGQIAGRAGRFQRDGTFGVTGAAAPMDDELAAAVEAHRFDPVREAYWRNSALDFASLAELTRSLAAPPPRPGLRAQEEALDERALRRIGADPQVADRCRDRWVLRRLWDVCQTPDFRKIGPEDHIALVRVLFDHLSRGEGVAPDAWMGEQHRRLDRTDGEIDALSARLAGVRTLAYVANQTDWLADPPRWREATRALEDRLSDILHEKLMARFVDRRTSVLMRGLHTGRDLLAGVASDGCVTVEGQFVGRLAGLRFEAASAVGALESRTLRATVVKAVAPEVARRLGRLAAEPDEAFALTAAGDILWRGESAGVLSNADPFKPRVRLVGELGPPTARERAARRLEAFVAAEACVRLAPLKRLADAIASGELRGLARGLAYRLIECGGAIGRAMVEGDLTHLSRAERRTLRGHGVRFGQFTLRLALPENGVALAHALASRAAPDWRPPAAGLAPLGEPHPPPQALGLRGRVRVGRFTAPVGDLERLGVHLQAGRSAAGFRLSEAARADLGWSVAETAQIMRALGYAPVGKSDPAQGPVWRKAPTRTANTNAAGPGAASPFAALAALRPAGRPAQRERPRRAGAKRDVRH
jgi:ATP-dependent RNA helicase SUPV3L1/SUV3